MTNWVITQTTRFRAAVSYAGLSNLISFYGTSLYHLLIETEFPGTLWENFDLLWHWSPLAHVQNVTTPTLFIHGDSDHDVPIEQAEEMYVALKKLGVDATYVRYPGEGHGFRKSESREDQNRRTLDWFKKYLHPEYVKYK
jgi:dipeptidyl aminopeptidase/acylaminoacyl peptidase